jgi:hypothetical protein
MVHNNNNDLSYFKILSGSSGSTPNGSLSSMVHNNNNDLSYFKILSGSSGSSSSSFYHLLYYHYHYDHHYRHRRASLSAIKHSNPQLAYFFPARSKKQKKVPAAPLQTSPSSTRRRHLVILIC